MSKVTIYNTAGEQVGTQELNPKIFGVEINEGLVHQAAVTQMANARTVLAHTKDRSEVRGGGKKPWKQKGTGRARHGSSRSPIWVGGGITFGPRKDRNFSKKINKKAKRKAMFMCLTDKVKEGKLVLVDKLALESGKTKDLTGILYKLPSGKKKTLLALEKSDKKLVQASKNLDKLWTNTVSTLNVLNLLNYEYLVMSVGAMKVLEKTYLK